MKPQLRENFSHKAIKPSQPPSLPDHLQHTTTLNNSQLYLPELTNVIIRANKHIYESNRTKCLEAHVPVSLYKSIFEKVKPTSFPKQIISGAQIGKQSLLSKWTKTFRIRPSPFYFCTVSNWNVCDIHRLISDPYEGKRQKQKRQASVCFLFLLFLFQEILEN